MTMTLIQLDSITRTYTMGTAEVNALRQELKEMRGALDKLSKRLEP